MNKQPEFDKYPDGLVPAIIQDANSNAVLMLGYMNKEAWQQTLATNKVTFYSRSKKRLWVKGETSGNFLNLISISLDCDEDALLIRVEPTGPVCHTGTDSCFGDVQLKGLFLPQLEQIIVDRVDGDTATSYTAQLFQKGIAKIAQKVGEEAVELVIEAMGNDEDLFKNEAADLLFHYLILLRAKGYSLNDIDGVLRLRHSQ